MIFADLLYVIGILICSFSNIRDTVELRTDRFIQTYATAS